MSKQWIKSIQIRDFDEYFPDDEKVMAYLSEEKWKDGYICRSCGNDNYCKGKKPYSRRCTRCKKEESPTAHTLFHHCRMPLKDAFRMAYMICNTPDISSYNLSSHFDTRQMTCWKLKKKIMACIEGSGELKLLAQDKKIEA